MQNHKQKPLFLSIEMLFLPLEAVPQLKPHKGQGFKPEPTSQALQGKTQQQVQNWNIGNGHQSQWDDSGHHKTRRESMTGMTMRQHHASPF